MQNKRAGEKVAVKKAGLFMCLLVLILGAGGNATYGFTGLKVNVRIEGYDKTIISQDVYAYTFSDALKALVNNDSIDIQLQTDGADSSIHSINGVENGHFGANDKWFSYIERDGKIVSENLLNATLKKEDKLVVYYGEFAKTHILDAFDITVSGNEIAFYAAAKNANWIMKNGGWTVDDDLKPVRDVRINMKMPNGNFKILRTGADGTAKTSLGPTGVYTYHAEKYNSGGCPSIVASETYYFLHGMENTDAVTRGEAAAFIVNTFGVKNGLADGNFQDVEKTNPHYNEIMAASSAGIIAGKEEGLFAPDETVNLTHFCIMLSNAAKLEPGDIAEYKNVPVWALKGVNGAIQSGFLRNIDFVWDGPVTGDMLLTVYRNHISRQ